MSACSAAPPRKTRWNVQHSTSEAAAKRAVTISPATAPPESKSPAMREALRPTLVLLPGLDGTGKLFGPFVERAHATFDVKVVEYPADERLGYPELEALVGRGLPTSGPFFLVAESFSGPIAI